MRRGSTRRFRPAPISLETLSSILACACQPLNADFRSESGFLNNLYVINHSTEGLAPGSHFLHPDRWCLELLRAGDFRDAAARLALEQRLAIDAAAAIFFLADLDAILSTFGDRGYRATQLEAGILGGRLYLASYAHQLGATGLTFYDDEVVEFFSPHAEGKSVIFLTAIGAAQKQPRLERVTLGPVAL